MDTNLRFSLRPKLQSAIQHLTTGSGSLKDRLQNVFVSHLLALKLDDTECDIQRLLREATALATSRADETGRIGTLRATLSRSGWQTDQKIAQKIFEAYELCWERISKGG